MQNTPCPACSSQTQDFAQKDKYDINRCPVCGHGFVVQPPSSEELSKLYCAHDTAPYSGNLELAEIYKNNPRDVFFYYRYFIKLIKHLSPQKIRPVTPCAISVSGIVCILLTKPGSRLGTIPVLGMSLRWRCWILCFLISCLLMDSHEGSSDI